MSQLPIFLSIVMVVRNNSNLLKDVISNIVGWANNSVSDFEIVIVDNSSNDQSIAILKQLTGTNGFPNLQIFALTTEVNFDTAVCVGLENALGDFVVIIDPDTFDISFIPKLLSESLGGVDIVFAKNSEKNIRNSQYKIAYYVFNKLYKIFNGISFVEQASHYRILSKRLINFILQHPQPEIAYRNLPFSHGFSRANLIYSAQPLKNSNHRSIIESVDYGIKLLVTNGRAPMRIVSILTLFGTFINLIYSIYIIIISVVKLDVAPGWVSISLQQSGMFFLISLVLFVLGEYILQMANITNKGPAYHIGQEFMSVNIIRKNRLNVESSFSESNSSKLAIKEALNIDVRS